MIRINEKKVSEPRIFTFSPRQSVQAQKDCTPQILSSQVKDFITNNKALVFPDTCSLIELREEQTEIMLMELVRTNADIVILSSVVNELHKLSQTSTTDIRRKATHVLKLLKKLQSNNLIRLELTNLPDFSDPNFLIVLAEKIIYNDIVLITQDRNLQLALKDMQHVIGKVSRHQRQALVCRIIKPSPAIIAC